MARRLLATAENRELADPAVMAALAHTHATLALVDRLGAVLDRLVRTPAAPRVSAAEQQALDESSIDTAAAVHPVVAADREWYRRRVEQARADGNAQALREATDLHNRARQQQLDEASQALSRTWITEEEMREVQVVESRIDPDVAATNRARRDEERRVAQMEREARLGVGIFGQMAPEEDG